jgi:hypothetical protein
VPATDKITARVGRELIDDARQAVGEPGATEGQLLRAGLYGLIMLSAGKRRQAMKLAALRRGWPPRGETPLAPLDVAEDRTPAQLAADGDSA